MKLEEQVCSLEFAKKLDELGVCVPSFAKYSDTGRLIWMGYTDDITLYLDDCRAYTVAELGAMLPWGVETHVIRCSTARCPKTPPVRWGIHAHLLGDIIAFKYADTEADARAKMLIWLLENGHITAEEINTAST